MAEVAENLQPTVELVLWNDRSVMHYALGDTSEQRIMHRIVVRGGKPK